MANQQFPFLLPPARMLWGHLYKPETTDYEGRPLVYKSGADQGKPRVEYNFGVAIPKVAGQHWAATVWGAPIWAAGHAGAANAGQLEDFSWKVIDGDSDKLPKLKPGKPQGKAPNQKAGYPGHWVLSLSSSFPPQICDGTQGDKFPTITQPDAVLAGDFIQVKGNATYNGSQGNPGVFLNHEVVCFSGYHPEGRLSSGGVDAAQVGFAAGAAPGATTTPVGAAAVPAPAAPPTATPVAPPAAYAAPPTPPVVQTHVAPNPAFAPPPPVVTPPPATPARVMLPAAGGVSYEDFITAGWTDAQLVQHGKMAA